MLTGTVLTIALTDIVNSCLITSLLPGEDGPARDRHKTRLPRS
jgi:hypothetical protein